MIIILLFLIINKSSSILIKNKITSLSSSLSLNKISSISLTSLSLNSFNNNNINNNNNENENGGGNEFNLFISSQLELATKILNCSRISLYFTNSDSNYDNNNNNNNNNNENENENENQLTLIYSFPNNNINDYIDDYNYNYNNNIKILSLPLYLESKIIGKLDIEDYNNIDNNNNNINLIINSISNTIAIEANRLSLISSLTSIKEQYNEMQYLHANCLLTTNTLGTNHNYHYNNKNLMTFILKGKCLKKD